MSQYGNIEFDRDLLIRYDRPGPRYTSYPPAPKFGESFGAKEFREAVEKNNRAAGKDISLYFHIPFCDTLCYFCGCNMMVTNNRPKIREYVDILKKEVDLFRRVIAHDRKVAQLHWGGGTPTHLTPEEIRDLATHIRTLFPFGPEIEAGVETDPRGLTFDHLQALRECGFNRASMGVQDFHEPVQKSVNRIQPEAMTREAFGWLRKLGFASINLDLIYGLPHQTVETFEKTIDIIIDIDPDRIALFNFAYVPWMKKHQKIIDPATLTPPEMKLRILEMSIRKLTAAGYAYIGMDHFAKPEDELCVAQRKKMLYRNFQGYSTHADCDLYALGITSISQFDDVYAQNAKTIKEWTAAALAGEFATVKGYRMTPDDIVRRVVIMRLMCDFELETKEIARTTGIDFPTYFAEALRDLAPMERDGLVAIADGTIRVTPRGRLLIRNIAMAFDAYLKEQTGKPAFSRTV